MLISVGICALVGVVVLWKSGGFEDDIVVIETLPGQNDTLKVAGMEFAWQQPAVDGRLTGVTVPGIDAFDKSIGVVSKGVYTSPNGRKFDSGSAPKVAEIMLEHQPHMAELREVIGYSEKGLIKSAPESPLSNWAADVLRNESEALFGEKIDVAVVNFGGIRVDFPAGNIILDDVRSMFPFKNYVCLVKLKGKDLNVILDELATRKLEAVSGCTLKARDRKLVKATVGGKAVDPKKVYNFVTIDFLLDGGDGHHFSRNAVSVKNSGVLIGDLMEKYVRQQTAEGKYIDQDVDGRIDIVLPEKKK